MFLLFGLMILLCIPPILFFLSKPVTPPSYSASDVYNIKLVGMC